MIIFSGEKIKKGGGGEFLSGYFASKTPFIGAWRGLSQIEAALPPISTPMSEFLQAGWWSSEQGWEYLTWINYMDKNGEFWSKGLPQGNILFKNLAAGGKLTFPSSVTESTAHYPFPVIKLPTD